MSALTSCYYQCFGALVPEAQLASPDQIMIMITATIDRSDAAEETKLLRQTQTKAVYIETVNHIQCPQDQTLTIMSCYVSVPITTYRKHCRSTPINNPVEIHTRIPAHTHTPSLADRGPTFHRSNVV